MLDGSIGTLLVANRGEVALRVLRTARRLGLRTVAVYSGPDRGSRHVREADRAVYLGPGTASRSYLSAEAVLAAARREGADAVHPGYGFLAEDAGFARACESQGLIFVGPQPDVIELMGRKDRARQVAFEAGAPVAPALAAGLPEGVLGARVASEIGFPALVKAVAGGGGKGMRVVGSEAELGRALDGARREALSAFGDGSLFIERYLPNGRHLEVQVVGDGAGKVLHLWDRDCSVQRRHQKVVEEAPASVNSPVARARALEAALRIASKVSYRSLGTVEFMAEGDDVYFLEMNTRLQVEHGVTEAVTGLDLVELQLRLACGQPLPFSQDEVISQGHAIEARIYAEDPEQGFLPQAGRVVHVRWPSGPSEARVESDLEEGQEVGTGYDPMVGKIIVHGPERDVARRKLIDAVDGSVIFGLTTNLGFLRGLLASDEFASASVTTSWADHRGASFARGGGQLPVVAAAVYLAGRKRTAGAQAGPFAADGWRGGGLFSPVRLYLLAEGQAHEVSVRRVGGGDDPDGEGRRHVVEGVGAPVEVAIAYAGGDELRLELEGAVEKFFVVPGEGRSVYVGYRGRSYLFDVGRGSTRPDLADEGAVVAPLPGILTVVSVVAGDNVKAGDVLGILESMKMEYPLVAKSPATVERALFAAGAHVGRGDVVFELSAAAVGVSAGPGGDAPGLAPEGAVTRDGAPS